VTFLITAPDVTYTVTFSPADLTGSAMNSTVAYIVAANEENQERNISKSQREQLYFSDIFINGN